jgi:chromosome segregation ATPase
VVALTQPTPLELIDAELAQVEQTAGKLLADRHLLEQQLASTWNNPDPALQAQHTGLTSQLIGVERRKVQLMADKAAAEVADQLAQFERLTLELSSIEQEQAAITGQLQHLAALKERLVGMYQDTNERYSTANGTRSNLHIAMNKAGVANVLISEILNKNQ